MIKVKKFISLDYTAYIDLENYLSVHNITRKQIISISYSATDTHERILLVYEENTMG